MASKKPISKKPMMSAAFMEKAKKERDKLQNVLATHLHADMLRMFKEGEFSDLSLSCGLDKLAVHSPLIQARLPDLYTLCVRLCGPKNGNEDHQEVNVGELGFSPEDAKKLIELMYTSDKIQSHWKEFQKAAIKSKAVQDQQDQSAPSKPITNSISETESPITNSVSEPDPCEGPITNSVTDPSEGPITNSVTDPSEGPANRIGEIGVDKLSIKGDEHEASGAMKWRKTDPKNNESTSNEEKQLSNGEVVSEETMTISSVELLDLASLPAPASPIGKDLLKMFACGCGHDVTIKVEDKEIKAHKFLLCNRSNYFAAMLGGGWRESNSAEISLEGASYSAVIAALCFIYGATPELPADVNIREIVYLADMYCLEGLKEVTALKLRQDNCHFFHKPCSGCLAGAPEAIMLSHGYRLTELYESTVRWVLKHIDRAWCQRSFAAMPSEVIHQCSEFAVTDLSHETAITMTIQVDKLVQSLPRVKWSDPVRREAEWLLDACIQYVAIHFLTMVGQSSFEKLLVGLGWNKGLLESLFHRIVCNLSEETAVPAYLAVNGLRLRASLDDWNMDALELVNKLISMCHSYMVKNVNYLMRSPSWARIPEELQKKIKEDAVFVDDEKKSLAPKPKLSSAQKPSSRPSSARPSAKNDSSSSSKPISARGDGGSSTRPTSARGAAGSSSSSSSRSSSSSSQRSTSRQSSRPTGNWKP